MTHVVFKGAAVRRRWICWAGRVQVFFATVPTILPQVKGPSGEAAGRDQQDALAAVPGYAHHGGSRHCRFRRQHAVGVLAPAGTPPDVVEKLELSPAVNESRGGASRWYANA